MRLLEVSEVANFCRKFGTSRCWFAGSFLLLSIALAPASFAQGRAALSGKVLDSQGALIPSAAVTATQTSTGATTTANTNANGEYVFPSLAASTYSLSVKAPGFKTYDQVGIVLQADQSVTV